LEISHRSPEFEAVLDEAVSLVKELFSVPEGYSVLFLQGGASTQFALAPYNLLPSTGKAAYLETGVWANKALKEAKFLARLMLLLHQKRATLLISLRIILSLLMLLISTSLQTIPFTVRSYRSSLASPIPVVCDMSSDIFSRKVNVADFGLIYAGAQKNMGPAGVPWLLLRMIF
jgi:phosphoserine aminotransferase